MAEPVDFVTGTPPASALPPVKTPIAVDPTPTKAVATTLIGAALIVFTGFPALLTILSARDLNAIRGWMASLDGATFLASAGFLGTLAWRVTASARKQLSLIIAARSARNRVAYVKGDPGAPR
jgi:hypothetical protein